MPPSQKGRLPTGILLLLAASAGCASQQVRSAMTLGHVRVRYANQVDAASLTATPALAIQSPRSFVGASAMLSQATAGGWTHVGTIDGSVFSSSTSVVAGELLGTLGGSVSSDGLAIRQQRIGARLHAGAGRAGGWIGAGVGSVAEAGEVRTHRLTEAGSWARVGAVVLSATVTPVVIADGLSYTDTQLSARFRAPRFEFDAGGGFRSASTASGVSSQWATATVAVHLSPRMTAVLSGGTYPRDPIQGFLAGRYASLGLRLTGPSRGTAAAASPDVVARISERTVGEGLTDWRLRRRGGSDRRELRVRAPRAAKVEVQGDFTLWQARSLTAEPNGWWVFVIELAPGSYEFAIRVDGGEWVAPPGLAEHRDEFGGRSGWLVLR